MAKYPDELKREALNLAAKPGMTVAQVERDLGITPGLIYKWRQRYRVDENSDELKPSAERESEAEIRRLQRELAIAREERDILKKAMLQQCSRRNATGEVPIHSGASAGVQRVGDVPRVGCEQKWLLRLVEARGEPAEAGRCEAAAMDSRNLRC